MTEFRKLADFGPETCTPAPEIGTPAQLCLLPLSALVVDDRYQRPISGGRGRTHVKRIVETFDWRKFTPVIVTAVGGGLYAIIDGQHRATAAMLHPDIDLVPCMVVEVTPAEAAQCFAAINGNVTRLSKGQVYRARVAGGDAGAMEIESVCRASGVTILMNKNGGTIRDYAPGESFAIGAIERCLKAHGRTVLVTALKAITETGGGNAGNLRATLIYALCDVLARRPSWRDAGAKLLDALDEIDLGDTMDAARASARRLQRSQTDVLTGMIEDHLAKRLTAVPQLAAPKARARDEVPA